MVPILRWIVQPVSKMSDMTNTMADTAKRAVVSPVDNTNQTEKGKTINSIKHLVRTG